MNRSDDIGALAAALARFHAEAQNPAADKTAEVRSRKGEASSYSYPYADLAQTLDKVRPLLAAQEIAVTQEVHVDVANALIGASTFILHSSGQWMEFDPLWIPAGSEAKEFGAATTYSRRYSLWAALGLAAADDGTPNTRTARRQAGASAAQLAKLQEEVEAAAVTPEQFLGEMQRNYGTTDPAELTTSQCSELIGALKKAPRRKPPTEQFAEGTVAEGTVAEYSEDDDDESDVPFGDALEQEPEPEPEGQQAFEG